MRTGHVIWAVLLFGLGFAVGIVHVRSENLHRAAKRGSVECYSSGVRVFKARVSFDDDGVTYDSTGNRVSVAGGTCITTVNP